MQQHYNALFTHIGDLKRQHAANEDAIDELDDLEAELTDVMNEHKATLERLRV